MSGFNSTWWLDAIVVVVILALAFTGMVLGWRARRRRQADLPRLAAPPAELGEILRHDELFYVATTRADAPLDRIVVHGLAFRARAGLTVASTGLRLDIAGEDPAFIPLADLRGVGRATWTIDRAVGKAGLVFVRFALGGGSAEGQRLDSQVLVDGYLRPDDPAGLVEAIQTLIPTEQKEAAA